MKYRVKEVGPNRFAVQSKSWIWPWSTTSCSDSDAPTSFAHWMSAIFSTEAEAIDTAEQFAADDKAEREHKARVVWESARG